jgi:hypothetical protein
VALLAAEGDAVFAFLRLATDPAASYATCIDHTAMDGAERWCSERREDERVRGNVSRDALLFAPGQSSGDEEVGVSAITLRAGRTARLPSVATGHEHEARSLGSSRPPSKYSTGPSRDGDRLTFEADR